MFPNVIRPGFRRIASLRHVGIVHLINDVPQESAGASSRIENCYPRLCARRAAVLRDGFGIGEPIGDAEVSLQNLVNAVHNVRDNRIRRVVYPTQLLFVRIIRL